MNKEIKAKWLAALRSGDYVQGTNALRTLNNEFCCLGVLCDLAEREGVVRKSVSSNPKEAAYAYGQSGATGFLPIEVCRWAGLDHDPQVVCDRLSFLNDSGVPFTKIADLIEKGL